MIVLSHWLAMDLLPERDFISYYAESIGASSFYLFIKMQNYAIRKSLYRQNSSRMLLKVWKKPEN